MALRVSNNRVSTKCADGIEHEAYDVVVVPRVSLLGSMSYLSL